ncbi:MAG: PilW family protein [Proteobacteria bacterium]|nr:PilW family protein [Pseudomonadota bacterium]
MINLQNINAKILHRQRGFSMVELLVAMLLGLFLLTALVEILLSGKQSFTAASHLSRLQENGRIATSMIVTDLKRAGYMGGNSDIPNIFGSAGQAAAAISCATGDTSWGRMVTQRIVGLDDTNAGYACIPNSSYLRGDVLTIRYASPWPSGAFGANQLHLRSSLFEGKIFAGVDQALAANLVLDQPQSVRDLIAHAYYVGNSGRSCSGQAVPSLFRVRLGNNSQPLIEELLPGIEHFQVQYGVGGQYLDADAVADWNQVVTARFWLLVRSECPETGFADARTYTLGDQVYTPNDSFRRQLYSSVVMLRN